MISSFCKLPPVAHQRDGAGKCRQPLRRPVEKISRCITATAFSLLGYLDSNQEMTESESVALPFGDSPISYNKVNYKGCLRKMQVLFLIFYTFSTERYYSQRRPEADSPSSARFRSARQNLFLLFCRCLMLSILRKPSAASLLLLFTPCGKNGIWW